VKIDPRRTSRREFVEDGVALFGRDAWARVRDLDRGPRAGAGGALAGFATRVHDHAALFRVFHRVRHEVAEDLTHTRRVRCHRQFIRGAHLQLQPGGVDLTTEVLGDFTREFGNLHSLHVELDLSRLGAGELQQVVDQAQRRLNGLPDPRHAFPCRSRRAFSSLGDLFVVYNHNLLTRDALTFVRRLAFESNQLLVKMQYAFRY
jgi:hypothetical protein